MKVTKLANTITIYDAHREILTRITCSSEYRAELLLEEILNEMSDAEFITTMEAQQSLRASTADFR